MENLHVQYPLPPNGRPAPVIEVPAEAATPLQTPLIVRSPEQSFHYAAGYASAAERERKRHRDMTVCGTLDALDLLVGWIPAVGQILDLITVCVCVNLFGPKGFYVLLEMIDFVGVVGAFVPTATLVAKSYWKEH
jgi:hypothetical protein